MKILQIGGDFVTYGSFFLFPLLHCDLHSGIRDDLGIQGLG